MLKKDCFFLGVIIKKYSFKGEVILKLDSDKSNGYTKLKSIFIESFNSLITYEINKLQIYKSGFLRLHLDGINTEDKAEKLLKKNVYLPLSILPPLHGKSFYYHEIYGFFAFDNKGDKIGLIKSVRDSKNQSLFVIDHKGTEVLVPIHNDLIADVNRKKKQIIINLPEGLLDIFNK